MSSAWRVTGSGRGWLTGTFAGLKRGTVAEELLVSGQHGERCLKAADNCCRLVAQKLVCALNEAHISAGFVMATANQLDVVYKISLERLKRFRAAPSLYSGSAEGAALSSGSI